MCIWQLLGWRNININFLSVIGVAFLLLLTSSHTGKPWHKQMLLSKWITRKMFALGSEYILSYISSQTIYYWPVQYHLLFTPQLCSGLYKLQVEIYSDEAIPHFFGSRSQTSPDETSSPSLEPPRMLTGVHHSQEQHLHKAEKGLWLLPSHEGWSCSLLDVQLLSIPFPTCLQSELWSNCTQEAVDLLKVKYFFQEMQHQPSHHLK